MITQTDMSKALDWALAVYNSKQWVIYNHEHMKQEILLI
jgi:hypothetical protein